jgi:hypothetical protein
MALQIILLAVIIVGAFFAFRGRGAVARSGRRYLLAGVVLTISGCVASLAYLDAETSGRGSVFQAVNPFVWLLLFIVGVVVMVMGAVMGFADDAERRRQRAESAARAAGDDVDRGDEDRPPDP